MGAVLKGRLLAKIGKGQMKKRLLIFSIGYLAACCWSQARQNGVQPLSIAETVLLDPNEKNPDLPVDDYVKERMRELHIPGLSLAVVKEGRIIKASGYGLRAWKQTHLPLQKQSIRPPRSANPSSQPPSCC